MKNKTHELKNRQNLTKNSIYKNKSHIICNSKKLNVKCQKIEKNEVFGSK